MIPDDRVSSDVAAKCLGEMSRIARAGAIEVPAPSTFEVERLELDRLHIVARAYRWVWMAAQLTGLVAAYATYAQGGDVLVVASFVGALLVSMWSWARWHAAAGELARSRLPTARIVR